MLNRDSSEKEWVVHFVGDRLSVPMNRSTAKKYLNNMPDADYIVKYKGKHQGIKIYKQEMIGVLFCEVYGGNTKQKLKLDKVKTDMH